MLERKIEPIEAIKKTRPVRGIRPVKLHRRPRYKSKLKGDLSEKNVVVAELEVEHETSAVNHAHYTPDGVGSHIDFKT